MKSIAIMGASGHCKVVADLALLNGYDDIVFVDKNPEIDMLGEYPVADEDTDLDYYIEKKYDFVVGIGEASIRRKVQEMLESKGVNIVTLIHPAAVVAYDVEIGAGTVVMAGAVVNPGTTIGKGCIINTSSSVDHDNVIGDYCHISVGAHTAGTVTMGDNCWLGIGAIVSNNIDICSDVFMGAGTVVVKNLTVAGRYFGIPARRLK
ncbi:MULTISPECIES: acetyltransferase [Pseudobutyrivibrio]|uniref:Transferase hexapeptide (Six repeat-containing protein) n=1 Tax=Pseudobutyrivibrio xylanivorans TaxID=185007 RepID=A0A1G5S073_PSEXY|nr:MULTISPECIES: acetyltransferase [Pseudobutyrivibrio]MDC7278759.1 acetyltransferase [Butyrivibrio fibrisolvens]SCZ79784.1 transferase hexapeptide (six repeat-containing protein) [Pseudobutyrivibrio xylanivorans]